MCPASRCADEFQRGVHAAGHEGPHSTGDGTVVENGVVHAVVLQRLHPAGLAGGGEHGGAEILRQRGGDQAERRRAARISSVCPARRSSPMLSEP